MKKINMLIIVFILGTMMFSKPANAQEMENGDFIHTVFFWLKNPESKPDREAFEKSLKKFIDQSEFIQTKHLGTPADTDRSVIDNSYTYCLMVSFASKEDHDKYQAEAGHKLFIEESSDLWEKVLVYDSVNTW